MQDQVAAPAKAMWKTQVFWLILALNFVFGAVFNFLPVTFPVFKRSFELSFEDLGRIQFVFFLAGVSFSFFGGWLVEHLGLKYAAAATLLGLSFSLTMVGSAWNYQLLLGTAFIFGLAVAALVVVYSAIICDTFPDSRQSLFFLSGIFDGIGAVVGPAALGEWLENSERTGSNWSIGYYATAVILAILLLWTVSLGSDLFSTPKAERTSVRDAIKIVSGILRSPAMWLIGIAYLLHGLAQVGMVSWVGQIFQNKDHITTAQAAYFISINSAGFFVGRSVLSWVTARWKIPDLLLLAVCAGGGAVAFAATLLSENYVLGLVAFAVAGFFICGDGPAINSYTGLRFVSDTATAFAILGGIGNIGAGVGPYLVGAIGTRMGLETGIWLMPLFTLALAMLAFGWFMRNKAGKHRLLASPSCNR